VLESNKKSSFRAWLIWGLGAMVFALSYFPRVAPSVMQPFLMHDFHIGGYGFGTLTAFFLYAYVPMQVPVGMLVDKFGARVLLYVMTLLAGIGCVVFASAHQIHYAQLGRFLTGFGASFGFVGAMKLAKEWFSSDHLGLLAGLTQALGMLGAALGEAPVSLSVHAWGWRPTMFMMAGMLFVLAVFVFIFVRDRVSSTVNDERVFNPIGFFEGLGIVLKNPQSWLNACYLGLAYAPTMAFAEAWGVSFLKQAYTLSDSMAAMAVGFVFVGWAIGGPLMGILSDKLKRRKSPMILSSLVAAILLSIVIFSSHLPATLLCVLLFFYGFSNTGVGVAYAVSGEINRNEVAGTSIAFANMASIVIGMILEPVVGYLLDHGEKVHGSYQYTTSSYHMALLVLPLGLLLSVLFACFVRETGCQ
jgi:MFS family permease